jgi:lysophospholipase L1-like esterase
VAALVVASGCLGTAVLTPGQGYADTGSQLDGGYVALGDSYVAGPGIPLQTGTPVGCARSDHDYPSLVSGVLRPSSFSDVSCSAATTREMTRAQSVTGGQNPPQLDALNQRTGLVTLSIGGNDVGFADIVRNCATTSPTQPTGAACQDFYTRAGHDVLAENVANTAPKVAAVLAEIRNRAPSATVLLVGYPTILPASGPGCFPVVPFSPGDVAYLRKIANELNAMLADQAAKAGAQYVDTAGPSVGHDVCQLPGTKWVEGLVPTSPAAPMHPNELGMQHTAADVLAALHVRVLAGS